MHINLIVKEISFTAYINFHTCKDSEKKCTIQPFVLPMTISSFVICYISSCSCTLICIHLGPINTAAARMMLLLEHELDVTNIAQSIANRKN